MDRATFAVSDPESQWWLLEKEIHYTMEEPRKDLSEILGYARDDQWYTDKSKVEQLYDLIESHDRNLLTELDLATDDEKRKQWLESAVAALRPETAEATAVSASEAPPAAVAPAASGSPAPAPTKKSIFGKKNADEAVVAAPTMDVTEAVKVVMHGLDDQRIADLARELQLPADEVRALLAELPDGFEQEVAKEALTIADQAS